MDLGAARVTFSPGRDVSGIENRLVRVAGAPDRESALELDTEGSWTFSQLFRVLAPAIGCSCTAARIRCRPRCRGRRVRGRLSASTICPTPPRSARLLRQTRQRDALLRARGAGARAGGRRQGAAVAGRPRRRRGVAGPAKSSPSRSRSPTRSGLGLPRTRFATEADARAAIESRGGEIVASRGLVKAVPLPRRARAGPLSAAPPRARALDVHHALPARPPRGGPGRARRPRSDGRDPRRARDDQVKRVSELAVAGEGDAAALVIRPPGGRNERKLAARDIAAMRTIATVVIPEDAYLLVEGDCPAITCRRLDRAGVATVRDLQRRGSDTFATAPPECCASTIPARARSSRSSRSSPARSACTSAASRSTTWPRRPRPLLVAFDVIRATCAHRGYRSRFVRNVTDVDDKIISAANAEERTSRRVAERVHRRDATTTCARWASRPPTSSRARPSTSPRSSTIIERLIDARPRLRRRRRRLLLGARVRRLRQALGPDASTSSRRARASRSASRSAARSTSRCGRRPSRASRPGTARGGRAGPAGTSSARRWRWRYLGEHVRHPRRRHRPDLPAPRERDRAVRGRVRQRPLRALLAAQRACVNFGGEKMSKSLGNVVTDPRGGRDRRPEALRLLSRASTTAARSTSRSASGATGEPGVSRS